ncbi:MAG: HlyD family efflux transporter periplasmic adaptor subunit [Bacteroidetes bacterium]|nr:HlyD family efflux transporter periplasmic adaptor subunit [Bacteroidota bacterium]
MKKLFLLLLLTGIFSCNNEKNKFDASGSFEAEETIISSEATGMLKQFSVEEGQELKAGQIIGYVDSTQLFLKKKQLDAQIKAVLSGRPDSEKQLAVLQEQLKNAEHEQKRFANLIQANAGTQKQLDDINAQIEVLKKQIEAQTSTLGITSGSITEQTSPLQIQIEQINDQLTKCKLVNPVNGTVLAKYTEQSEIAAAGKPLYKIADISSLLLRAYVTGTQLSQIKLDQKVKVLIDKNEKEYSEHEGTIVWISDKAEFTPKTIQTKEERANLVYAVKIKTANDGSLKIGMYGEVKF